jgi:diacylglycerol kinase (CTP)
MELKLRNDLHLSRKIWHLIGIALIANIMAYLAPRDSLFLLAIAALVIIPFDILRLKRPDLNHRIITLFKPVLRIEEVAKVSGATFLIIGAFSVILLFPKPVAVLAMLLLAFGDPVSSAFGILFGKDRIWGNKSLQGSLACFVICTAVCAVYFLLNNIMVERIVLVSVLGGLIGAVSELAQFRKLDDNMTFPILAGLGLWCLFALFGGFS